jgi:LPXTG-motif cell wall-anchored protein
MRRFTAALSLSAVLALGGAGAAGASQPKTTICHPVASATGGNTHAGYSIITTANPSVHIDEETGAPKHEHDGRVDFVVSEERPCPPEQTSPTPTPSPSPSPEPSPSVSPSPTDTPSETPSPTVTESPSSPSGPSGSARHGDLPKTGPVTAERAATLAAVAFVLGTLMLVATRRKA